MKTINTLIIATLLLVAASTNAQGNYNDETISAETFIRMNNNAGGPFAISPVKVVNANNGFAVKWQTVNETNIASFELESGQDKKTFTTVKKMDPGNSIQPANIYQVEFSMDAIRSEKTYFRVKTTFGNGTVNYTDVAMVKVKKANN